jgi:CheY-like chemotaxis protein
MYLRERPDVILMDMMMPVMDGLDATKAIRKIENETGVRQVPIIALTANALQSHEEACLEVGMDDFLSKPIRKQALLDALHQWTEDRDSAEPQNKLEA